MCSAIVCNDPMVADQRILSDIGPAIGICTALEWIGAFIGSWSYGTCDPFPSQTLTTGSWPASGNHTLVAGALLS